MTQVSAPRPTDYGDELADKELYAKLSSEMADIKHNMFARGRLPDMEFRSLSKRRALLVEQLNEINIRQQKRRAERRMASDQEQLEWHAAKRLMKEAEEKMAEAEEIARRSGPRLVSMIASVSRLRAVYKDQSLDGTRTDAVRFMANKFQEELGKIIAGEI